MAEEYYNKCLAALQAMYETPNVSESLRRDADSFLQLFAQNPISWEISDKILHQQNLPRTFYFFAANTLTIRLRTHFGDLTTNQMRTSFRDSLVQHLHRFYSNATQISSCFSPNGTNHLTIVERLSNALSILILHMISIGEWATALPDIANMLLGAEVCNNPNEQILPNYYNPQLLSQLLVLLRVLAALPDTLNDRRFVYLQDAVEERPIEALTQFKPFLFKILANIFYATKPVMWMKNIDNIIKTNAATFDITAQQLELFSQHYSTTLFQLTPQQRQMYLELATTSLHIVHTWSQYRLITLSDTLCFLIHPSTDPSLQYEHLFQTPLPPEPGQGLVTQLAPQPSQHSITHSLYTLLLNLLTYPDLTSLVARVLSSLYTLQPASSNASQGSNFISIHSGTPNNEKPAWLFDFATTMTTRSIVSTYQRLYSEADCEQLAIGLMVTFCDFITLFINYLGDDQTLQKDQDLLYAILQPLLQLVQLTLRPISAQFTNQVLQSMSQTLSISTINSQNALLPQSHLPQMILHKLPPQHLEQLRSYQNLFVPLYLFDPFSDRIPEVELYPNQAIVSRRSMVVPVFGLIADLSEALDRTREYNYYEEDNHRNSLQTPGLSNDDISYHEVCMLHAQQATQTLQNRVTLFQPLLFNLLQSMFLMAQSPSRDNLHKDYFSDGEEASFRTYATTLLLDIIGMIGSHRIFSIWFGLFEQFSQVYQAYLNAYPLQHPTHPNTNSIPHSPQQLTDLTQQAVPFFQQYNATSLVDAKNNTALTSQPQHNLDNFIPRIALYDPLNAPDGWQPLEQLIWSLSILANGIYKSFTYNFQVGDYDPRCNDPHSRYTGKVFSNVRFHVCEFGKQYHPDGPYGSQFVDSFITDEIDMLTFMEQLGIIFDLYINQLHRNMNTITSLAMCTFIKSFAPFLTLPICLSQATGHILNEPAKSKPTFTSNTQITRLLIQILLSFSLYPQSLFTHVPRNYQLQSNDQVAHTVLTMARPESVQSAMAEMLQVALLLPQEALTSLLTLVQSNVYAITSSFGELLFFFFSFIIKRIVYNAMVLQPQYFFNCFQQRATLNYNTIVPSPGYLNLWSSVSLSQCLCSIITVLPDDNTYQTTLHQFTFSLFSQVNDLYTAYQDWVQTAIVKLHELYSDNNPSSQQQYQLYTQLFSNITWNTEGIVANVLQSIRMLFAGSARPAHLITTPLPPDPITPWNTPDLARIKLIANAVQDSLPFFQGIVKSFSIQQYALPSNPLDQQGGSNIIREHIIVDKISNIWAMALKQCDVHAISMFASICTTACQFFQQTQHSSFLYLADVAIRTATHIENVCKENNKPIDFVASEIVKEFSNYFSPTIFSLTNTTITSKHPRHISFDMIQHGYLLSNQALLQPQLLQQQQQRWDSILTTFQAIFPNNHQTTNVADPLRHSQLPPNMEQYIPITVKPINLLSTHNFQQIHTVNQLFMENFPEVVEDYIGFLTAIRFNSPQLFFNDSHFPQMISFLTSALYHSRLEVYELTISLLKSLYSPFIYNHADRTHYPSAVCQDVSQLHQLLQSNPQQQQQIIQSSNSTTRIATPYSIHYRYLNYLDNYKINHLHQNAYTFISLYTPTLFTHIILSLFTHTRTSNMTLKMIPFITHLLQTLAAFIYQNLEPIELDRYPIASLQQSITKYISSIFTDYSVILPVCQTASIDDPIWASKPPLHIDQFSQPTQDQYQALHSTQTPLLIQLLVDSVSLFLTPHYTTQPYLINELYQQMQQQPHQPASSIMPLPKAYTSTPDPLVLTGIVKGLIASVNTPTQRVTNGLHRDLRSLVLFIKGDTESKDDGTNNDE